MLSTYRKENPAKTFPLVPQLDLRVNQRAKHRDLHEKRSPTTVLRRPSADLSPFQGDQGGVAPGGQREARGIDTGICTKKGHRRESMTFFRGDSRIRTGDPLLAKQVLYQLSYTPKGVPGRPVKVC